MHFIIISSPSGGGKTTLCNMLMNDSRSPVENQVKFSISATTRQKRDHETNGKEYFFLSVETFQNMLSQNEFLEYAQICGNFYGTPKSEISKTHHTLFDIDFQGFIQINENSVNNLLSIFLLPPSLATLQNRLEQRGDIPPAIINDRMQNAILDISHSKNYEYIITNNTIEETFKKICAIVDFKINSIESATHTAIVKNTASIQALQTENVDEYLREAQLCTQQCTL